MSEYDMSLTSYPDDEEYTDQVQMVANNIYNKIGMDLWRGDPGQMIFEMKLEASGWLSDPQPGWDNYKVRKLLRDAYLLVSHRVDDVVAKLQIETNRLTDAIDTGDFTSVDESEWTENYPNTSNIGYKENA